MPDDSNEAMEQEVDGEQFVGPEEANSETESFYEDVRRFSVLRSRILEHEHDHVPICFV
jgi:hypothetical protein